MIRNALYQLSLGQMSRREFVSTLGKMGVGALAASQLAESVAMAATDDELLELSDVTGGQVTCELLRQWGVKFVFGNTGGYEPGFLDALVDYPDIQYVLGLHEGVVMAMADGYARVTGRTSFVNIHSITGTANALGLIVNAWADNSPVVITAGLSPSSGDNLGTFTETNKLETIPELYTRQSLRATNIENLSESLRQSFRLASTMPSSPVYLGVPSDVWTGKVSNATIIPPGRTTSRYSISPDPEAVAEAVSMIRKAKNPLFVAGAELPRWGGLQELIDLADLLGATVSGDIQFSRSSMGFPASHSRYLGPLRRPIESELPFDLLILAGTSRFTLAGGRAASLYPDGAPIIEFGLRPDHLTRNAPADLLIYAHAGETLEHILKGMRSVSIDREQKNARNRNGIALKAKRKQALDKSLGEARKGTTITASMLAAAVNEHIDGNAIVVTEGVSSDGAISDYVEFDQVNGGRQHFISSGGSLGWGLGAAVGVKLGAGEKQVALLLGDGSYQFGIQALWTASRFELPLIIVIFNNQAYQANRWGIASVRGRSVETGRYIGINIDNPDINHVGIAQSYGIDGERVTKSADLAAAMRHAVAAEKKGKAYVLDVLIDKHGPGAEDSEWVES